MPDNLVDFGMPYILRLKSMRLGLGLSQAKFAARAGIDRNTVSRCENGYSIQDLSCTKIEDAVVKAAAAANQVIGPIEISSNGKTGPMPKKGSAGPKKKPKSAPRKRS